MIAPVGSNEFFVRLTIWNLDGSAFQNYISIIFNGHKNSVCLIIGPKIISFWSSHIKSNLWEYSYEIWIRPRRGSSHGFIQSKLLDLKHFRCSLRKSAWSRYLNKQSSTKDLNQILTWNFNHCPDDLGSQNIDRFWIQFWV